MNEKAEGFGRAEGAALDGVSRDGRLGEAGKVVWKKEERVWTTERNLDDRGTRPCPRTTVDARENSSRERDAEGGRIACSR